MKFAWIDRIIEHCQNYPNNTYMLQTKDAEQMFKYFKNRNLELPDNFLLGITLETDIDRMLSFSGGNYFYDRAEWLRIINHKRKYITIEPVINFSNEFINIIKVVEPELIYIGANSLKEVTLPEPSKVEVLQLILELEKICPVKQKSNLKRLLK